MAVFLINGKQVSEEKFSKMIPNFSLEDVSVSTGHLSTRHKLPPQINEEAKKKQQLERLELLHFPKLAEDLLKMAEDSQAKNGGRVSREFPDEQEEVERKYRESAFDKYLRSDKSDWLKVDMWTGKTEPLSEEDEYWLGFGNSSNDMFLKGRKKAGVKHNSNKLPMSKLFNQFPNALQAVVLSSFYGHNKYPEDTDWLNFLRVDGGSLNYRDAAVRHALEGDTDKESGLPHIFHELWNKMAECELFCRENSIDVKTFSENYIKNLCIK